MVMDKCYMGQMILYYTLLALSILLHFSYSFFNGYNVYHECKIFSDNFTFNITWKRWKVFNHQYNVKVLQSSFTKFLWTHNSGFQVLKLTFDIMHVIFDIWYIPFHWATTSVAPKICFINHHTLSCWRPTSFRLLPRPSFLKNSCLLYEEN